MSDTPTASSAILFLRKKRMAFPALAEAKAIGDGEPAYGARLIIDPSDPDVKVLDNAIAAVAKAKWKGDAEAVLRMLVEEGKVAFSKKEYRDKKKGKVYAGFEDKYHLGARNAKEQPTVVDRFGGEIEKKSDIERILYSGCNVNAKIEIWAQDNSYGRRINCTLLGIMFNSDGESFGGGTGRASAREFSDMVESTGEDLV